MSPNLKCSSRLATAARAWPWFDWGATRIVILVGGWVFKFPRPTSWRLLLLGLLANMQENRFWRTKWDTLAPVTFALPGGWLTVMRRARILTQDEFDRLDLESWVDRGDYVVPVEIKRNSFGWIDGKLVAVDYGN